MYHSYQLTKHPIGSIREMFALSWPLMLGLLSTTFMLFVDRLFLAKFDPLALNAGANAGLAFYMFLVIPMSIVGISEVLVGRLNGDNQKFSIGCAAWQMIWFSLLLTPLLWFLGWAMPPLIFAGTGNEVWETDFFSSLMWFAPVYLTTIALSGFFIGTGQVKIVTVAAVLGNVTNIVLDYIFIFGMGSFPSLGVKGAAIATGLSQVIQVVLMLSLFLGPKLSRSYHTRRYHFYRPYFQEGFNIGFPAALGRFMELVAHFVFFRIVMSVNSEQMTLVAMVQSFYILSTFITEAEQKAASAIISNLLGARAHAFFPQVLKSAFLLQGLYFLLFLALVTLFGGQIFALLSPPGLNPDLSQTFFYALLYTAIFFLFDGLGMILMGFLTASGDTRYILLVSAAVHWIAYILPTLVFIGYAKNGADTAWGIIAFMSVFSFGLYYWRYWTDAWLGKMKRVIT